MKKTATVLATALLCTSLFAACGGMQTPAAAVGLPEAGTPPALHTPVEEETLPLEQEAPSEPLPETPDGHEAQTGETPGFIQDMLDTYSGLTTEELRAAVPEDAIEQNPLDYLTTFIFPYTLHGVEGTISVSASRTEANPDGLTDGLGFVVRGASFDIFQDAATEIARDTNTFSTEYYVAEPYQKDLPTSFDPFSLETPEGYKGYTGSGGYTYNGGETYFGLYFLTEGCLEPYYDSFTSITGDAFPVFTFEVYLLPL